MTLWKATAAFTFVALATMAGCRATPKALRGWTGWAYPDPNDMEKAVQTGRFASLAECRRATIEVLRVEIERRNKQRDHADEPLALERADYECGLNCVPGPNLYVCDETMR